MWITVKFKVGQKVRCIHARAYGGVKVGEIYTILAINGKGNFQLDNIWELTFTNYDYQCFERFGINITKELVKVKIP